MKIKEPMKTELVNALRSSKYKQTTGALKEPSDQHVQNGPTFCCLGVICDLHDSSGWDGELYDLESQFLPQNLVREYFENSDKLGGLSSEQMEQAKAMFGNRYTRYTDLAEMNDGGLSFDQIADFIEAHC